MNCGGSYLLLNEGETHHTAAINLPNWKILALTLQTLHFFTHFKQLLQNLDKYCHFTEIFRGNKKLLYGRI